MLPNPHWLARAIWLRCKIPVRVRATAIGHMAVWPADPNIGWDSCADDVNPPWSWPIAKGVIFLDEEPPQSLGPE